MLTSNMTHKNAAYTVAEERAHAVTHGIGVILSIVGLSWMLYLSIGTSDPWRVVASGIYGTSLITLFLASTLYHSFHASQHRQVLKLLDHCAIYLLIAGTYTPFLLVSMRNESGWWMFGIVWTLATAGILTKLWFKHRYPKVSLAGYLLMGWIMVFAMPQIANAIGSSGLVWLIAGGLSYTVGAIFYASNKIWYNHTIWHLFVLAGGVCHFLAVAWYVLPVRDGLAVAG
jgi:hemolysin III